MSTQLLSLSLWLTECGFAITFVVDEDGNAGRFELYERNGKDIPAAYVVSGLSGLNSWPTHIYTLLWTSQSPHLSLTTLSAVL